MKLIQKPLPKEYPTAAQSYMDEIANDGKVLDHMLVNFIQMKKLVSTLPEEILTEKKTNWELSIKEMMVHLMDDERIYVYRALRYSRNDETPLRDYDMEEYAANSDANNRSIESIFEEYKLVRESTISFFNNLPEYKFISGRSDARNYDYKTVRAIVYHIAGYQQQQFKLIKANLLKHVYSI